MELKWYWLLSAWAGWVAAAAFYAVLGRDPTFIESVALVVLSFLWIEHVTVPTLDEYEFWLPGTPPENGNPGGGTNDRRNGGDDAGLVGGHASLHQVGPGHGKQPDRERGKDERTERLSSFLGPDVTMPHDTNMVPQV